MPTYEYRCDSCKRHYDRRESFSAASSHTCQHCEKGTAKRILHAPTVVFKGSGFYSTDSRKSQAGASSNSSSEKSAEKSSESKSAKSSESSSKD